MKSEGTLEKTISRPIYNDNFFSFLLLEWGKKINFIVISVERNYS